MCQHIGRQFPDQITVVRYQFRRGLRRWRIRFGDGRPRLGWLRDALLHLEQALMDGLGALVETGREAGQRLAQLGVLPRQPLQANGLPQPQAHQAAEQGTGDALINPGPEGQANQHENPLHAAITRMVGQVSRIPRGQ
ncbi:hypothetical protein FQZ97_503820 [compost metagenome]